MFSLAPIVNALKTRPAGFAAPTKWFRQVEGAAEYAKRRVGADTPLPGAWVVRQPEKVRQLDNEGRMVELTVRFRVVIGITNERVALVGECDDALLTYRRAAANILMGFQAADETRPIRFVGGAPIEYTDGDLWWADEYDFTAVIDNFESASASPFDALTYTI